MASKLHVGGEFNAAYMAVFDDDGEGEPGNERNTDGLFQDAEIHFTGSTVLDNGSRVGRTHRACRRGRLRAARSTKPGSISAAASARSGWARSTTPWPCCA
jgi:hypothetical protein